MKPFGLAWLLLLGVLTLSGPARAAAGAAIVLHPAAELPGARYALGDIAEIRSADPALVRRLAALPIGEVPRLGYSQVVSRAQVQAVLRQALPAGDLSWLGADEIRLRGQGQRVAAAALTDAAARALFAQLQGQADVLSLQPVGALEAISVPAGALGLSARVPAPDRLARRMSALVDVSVDGTVYTTVVAWFSVRAQRPALLAQVALRPGDALRAGDFRRQTVDVADASGQALPASLSLDGLQLRRALEPGTVLTAAHVQPRPSVSRDDRVTVRVVQGTVTIETTGRALSDARIGELIKVSSTTSIEPYTARVVADGVVLVGTR